MARRDGAGSRTEIERDAVAAALAAFDASPDAFAAVGPDDRILAINRRAEQLLGWSRDELLGHPDPSVIPGQEVTYATAVARLRDHESPGPVLAQRVTKHGERVTLLFTGYAPFTVPDRGAAIGAFFRLATAEEEREQRRNELSRALVEASRVDEVLLAVHRSVQEVVGATVGVVLADCSRGHLHGEHLTGGRQEDAEQVELPLTEGAPWLRALEAGPTVGRLSVGHHDLAPTLFVPMGPPKDRRILALVYDDEVPRDPATHELATALADEAWLGLQRAALVSELEGKVEILEATAAVAGAVGLDLQDTLEAICRHAAAALSCERAGVYLRQPDGALEIWHLWASDLDVDQPPGDRLAAEVLGRGTQVLVQDTGACDFLDGPWHRDEGVVAVYGLPLRVADRDIGVLAVAHTQANPRGFTNLCQQVAAAVAQQAAIAIEHARLYQAQQATVERLRSLDEMKADYVAGITHDLRSPLTGLLGFARTMRRLGDTVDAERRTEYLGVMERQATRLVAMVEDLLLAAQMDDGGLRPNNLEVVPLAELVAAAVEAYEPARYRRVRVVEAPLDLAVHGDRSQLLRVVSNLLDNALKYSPETEGIEVAIRPDHDRVALTVRDHGPGIGPAQEEEEEIFGRFRRGAEGDRRGSTGLGLYISRGIARGHGGDVTFETADGAGTVFSLVLPRHDAG